MDFITAGISAGRHGVERIAQKIPETKQKPPFCVSPTHERRFLVENRCPSVLKKTPPLPDVFTCPGPRLPQRRFDPVSRGLGNSAVPVEVRACPVSHGPVDGQQFLAKPGTMAAHQQVHPHGHPAAKGQVPVKGLGHQPTDLPTTRHPFCHMRPPYAAPADSQLFSRHFRRPIRAR